MPEFTEQFVAVFDTNVLIPLVIPASKSAYLFLRLETAGHAVALSPQIQDEAAEKMRTSSKVRKWLQLSDEEIERFLSRLPVICRMVAGSERATAL
jgi:hypothetical protein